MNSFLENEKTVVLHLNNHTYYSLRYGTMSPEMLVRAAQAKGIDTLALTDINNTSCVIEFVALCKEAGIKPIVGIEFRENNRLLYIGLAKNHEGFYELNKLLTESSLKEKKLPELAPLMELSLIHI